MFFKVLYQPHAHTAHVREHTNSMYVEAESEREVRSKLSEREISIEFIQKLDEVHLAYEKKSDHFQIESI